MFARVLLPVDLSDRNGPALEAAAELAAGGTGKILLLHVIEEIEGVEESELRSFYSGLRSRAEEFLSELASRLAERGVATETRISTGKRGVEIVRCARERHCDLVVMRSHTLDPAHPARGLGTISHQVGLAAPCAVLLVR